LKLCFPAGHYYSPIVDPDDPFVRDAYTTEASPTQPPESLGLDAGEMLAWFGKIASHAQSHTFPEQPAEGRRYYYANGNFPLADALALLGFMKERKPRRLVEVGSGFSSCAAVDINEAHLNGGVELTFIEPYPDLVRQLLGEGSPYLACIRPQRLQEVPLEAFESLEPGDILFIDSSHVAKTGSDVLDYMFRVLPALRDGVLVHIHDIFYPFEYPRAWIVDENRSWNEAYLLRAFLEGNRRYRVLFFSDWIYKCNRALAEEAIPLWSANRGGSLWLEKLPAGA
jgi:methyltransferase family protein